MTRPKNTRTTKWDIWAESYHGTRKEATVFAKRWKGPTEIKFIGDAKTPWGQSRKDQWRFRGFYPTMYRGQKVLTQALTLEQRKFHDKTSLVKIRGNTYSIGPKVVHARKRRKRKVKK